MSRVKIDNQKIIPEEKKQKITDFLVDRWGKRYTQYRSNWNSMGDFRLNVDFPMHIDFDSTDACNLRCKHCWGERVAYKRTNEKMPDEIIDAVFDEADSKKNSGKLCAVNVGNLGESLLYPDKVFKILKKCKQAKVMEKFIHTNGHFLTLDVFKELTRLDLTYLLISLDAIKEETYNIVRGGRFQEVLNNILSILEYKKRNNFFFPIIRVSFVDSELNTTEKQEFIDFFEDKVDFIDIQPLVDYTKQTPEGVKIPFHCHMPLVRMTIGLKGQMALCCSGYAMLPGFFIGTFPEDSIYDTWNGEKANHLRNALKVNDFKEFPYCYKCLTNRL